MSLEHWGPTGDAWNVSVYSSCGTPTRVVLQVATGTYRSDARVDFLLAQALSGISQHLPGAEILLVPVNGGPDGNLCYLGDSVVYSSAIYQQMVDAIVRSGVSAPLDEFTVGDCNHYSDLKGHVTQAGARYLAESFDV